MNGKFNQSSLNVLKLHVILSCNFEQVFVVS